MAIDRTTLTWLGSLLADWSGPWWMGSGPEGSAPAEDAPTGAADEDGPDEATETATVGERDGSIPAPDGSDPGEAFLDDPPVSKQEIHLELGLKPPEFIAWLVRNDGGRTWQKDLVDTTGWSKSTVSRYLERLESNGTVRRVQVGRQKLVALPGEMPDPVPTSDGTPPDSLAGV